MENIELWLNAGCGIEATGLDRVSITSNKIIGASLRIPGHGRAPIVICSVCGGTYAKMGAAEEPIRCRGCKA
jgi:hypothetical protein